MKVRGLYSKGLEFDFGYGINLSINLEEDIDGKAFVRLVKRMPTIEALIYESVNGPKITPLEMVTQ